MFFAPRVLIFSILPITISVFFICVDVVFTDASKLSNNRESIRQHAAVRHPATIIVSGDERNVAMAYDLAGDGSENASLGKNKLHSDSSSSGSAAGFRRSKKFLNDKEKCEEIQESCPDDTFCIDRGGKNCHCDELYDSICVYVKPDDESEEAEDQSGT